MREETWFNDFVFKVDEFLNADECETYIQMAEDIGFEDALVTTARGSIRVPSLRNNERVMFQNEEVANALWERASDFVPTEFESRSACGVNELIRFYRYDPGQQFNWHQDFSFERDGGERSGEKSYLTFLIYLNDGFEGGETSFDDSYSDDSFDEFQVVPSKGMALFFEHPIYHKGEPVTKGRKYVMRTDVMYSADDSEDRQFESFDDVDNW